jgi:hypothetical protein
MPFRQIPVPITLIRPRHELPTPGFLQPATTRPFGNLGTLILSNHALHLGQQLALRTVAEGILEKDDLRVQLGKLFDQEPLMRIIPGQSVGRQDHHGVELPTPGRVTQPVQRRAVQPCPADAIIAIFMFRQQGPPLVLNVLFESVLLTLDGPFVLLLLGRDPRIVGYLHWGPPDVPE